MTLHERMQEHASKDETVVRQQSEPLADPAVEQLRRASAVIARAKGRHRAESDEILDALRAGGALKAIGAPPLSPAQVDRIIAILR